MVFLFQIRNFSLAFGAAESVGITCCLVSANTTSNPSLCSCHKNHYSMQPWIEAGHCYCYPLLDGKMCISIQAKWWWWMFTIAAYRQAMAKLVVLVRGLAALDVVCHLSDKLGYLWQWCFHDNSTIKLVLLVYCHLSYGISTQLIFSNSRHASTYWSIRAVRLDAIPDAGSDSYTGMSVSGNWTTVSSLRVTSIAVSV